MNRRFHRLLRKSPLGDGPWQFASWVGRSLTRLTYAVLVEPTWLEINRLVLPIAGAPADFRLRIVQLSDFHLQRSVPARYIQECVDTANAEQPDLLALTGDFVHKGPKFVTAAADLLAGLSAPLGRFAVLGNHDYSVRNVLGVRRYPRLNQQVAEALTARGIRVLRNELVRLEHNGVPFQLSGVDDLWSRECRPEAVRAVLDPALPHIIMAHNPRTIELWGNERCDLMLSGHTHGGQIHLERFGSVTLSKKMQGYAAGLYTVQGHALYVNKGVGYGLPVRYNRRPEIAVFDLVAGTTAVPTDPLASISTGGTP